jgi:hypothetical protein
MMKTPSAFDNFLYLLSEMEKTVSRDQVHWPERQTQAIVERLARISRKVAQAADQKGRKPEAG